MAASDHLSQPQFFHGSAEKFEPGHILTREGAWRGFQRKYSPGITDEQLDQRAARHRQWNFEEPRESHLYYGDRSLLDSGESVGYGGHVYAVAPETPAGRPTKVHKPDPNYTKEGMTGAYRTTGRLRVLHEVDREGNPL